jgi:hypothetical protein
MSVLRQVTSPSYAYDVVQQPMVSQALASTKMPNVGEVPVTLCMLCCCPGVDGCVCLAVPSLLCDCCG